jgi:hypothetical protein
MVERWHFSYHGIRMDRFNDEMDEDDLEEDGKNSTADEREPSQTDEARQISVYSALMELKKVRNKQRKW